MGWSWVAPFLGVGTGAQDRLVVACLSSGCWHMSRMVWAWDAWGSVKFLHGCGPIPCAFSASRLGGYGGVTPAPFFWWGSSTFVDGFP